MRTSTVWLILVGIVVGTYGCTSPNPRSCADGACTDPSLPFCDVDGAIAGAKDTCIAVTCTPNEHASCRGDVAVRCNSEGSNYDLVMCALGCSEAIGGCATCTTDGECNNPTPVCEPTTRACRGCLVDDECPSGVCDLEGGRCLEPSEVQYASTIGPDSGSCSRSAPCSLPYAVTQASSDPLRATVRLSPGRYTREITVTSGVVRLVGSDESIIGGQDPMNVLLQVDVGASLFVRGLRLDLVRDRFSCGIPTPTGPQLATVHLSDVVIDTLRSGVTVNPSCNVTLRRVQIVGASSVEGVAAIVVAGTGSTLDADALRVESVTPLPAYVNFSTGTVRIMNSIFTNAQVLVTTQAMVRMAFSTIVIPTYAGIRDTGTIGVTAENNIVSSTGNAVECTVCTSVTKNLLFPQALPALVPNNTVADPQFVDLSVGNYNLQATSPAVNAAVPSTGLATDHDYLGTARPQGAAPDIGAFELAP